MALTSYSMGKTVTTTGADVQIFGVPFNPYIVNQTGITNTVADGGTFDLTGFQYGHEVIVALGTWDDLVSHSIVFRKGTTTLFTSTFTSLGFISYIGIDYDEIMENGTDYYIDFKTGATVDATLNFVVTNFPTIVGPVNSGRIWVEGDNICFIDAVLTTNGYKHTIKNDGTSYSTGKTAGMMWIDTTNNGKICYIDSSGVERKTHTGDINGSQQGNETSLSGKTAGMMWISDNPGNYGYITFIGYDGNGYRIMNGTV